MHGQSLAQKLLLGGLSLPEKLHIQNIADDQAINSAALLSQGGVLDNNNFFGGLAGSIMETPDMIQRRNEIVGNLALALMGGGFNKLPLDKASRMARAKKMGFDTETPLFHGTNADVKEFNLSLGGKTSGSRVGEVGVSLSDSPQVASEFADRAGPEGANIIQGFVRPGKATSLDLPEDAGNLQVASTLLDAFDNGFDVVRLTNYTTPRGLKGQNVFVVKDPKNFRSVNAVFDPKRAKSGDILAGAGAGTALLSEMLLRDNQ